MSFVALHNHSDYSLLDGASHLPRLVARAKELGMPALALTDHGVMYGAIELLKLCRQAGIKPVIGNEMYIINGSITAPQQKRERRYHLVVLAKNDQGYRNLVKLTSISHLQGMRGRGIFSRPCIDKELLEKHKEGLIISTACLGGEIPQAILQGRLDVARQVAAWYQNCFGDDFYLEIQDHGSYEDRIVNTEIVKIAHGLGIDVIATNDAHYLSNQDVEAHDTLLCILTGKMVTDEKRLRYTGTEYLKSPEEMACLFQDHLEPQVIQRAMANTLAVAEKVEDYDILGKCRMPHFPGLPEQATPIDHLRHVSRDGLQQQLQQPDWEAVVSRYPTYGERLERELEIIERMGFPTYFLVVWDYIRFARLQKIPVGPGRGSAAGSLVAFALEITNIDPVDHGLLFERFLNPERKSMPDIDTDFCIERRGEVIDYVTQLYGGDRVAQIITFNRMTSKAVLKDVARVLDIPYGEADRLAKLIPVVRGKPVKLKVMLGDKTPASEFREKYRKDEKVRRWIDLALRIEGTNKTYGVHAAGVVIGADPLDELVPLQRSNEGQVITQYPMDDVESMGLLKMDFLGLKTLTMIDKALELIQQTRDEHLDLYTLPQDDKDTYGLLSKGDLEGIFQLESSGMRQVVCDLRPSSLEDLSSILALYRPGPLDAGLIPKFINRKHGREQVHVTHAKLQPILEETYGIMVYQEQIMRIAQDLAGYSLGQADLLRRAMGKKKITEMEKHRTIFINGAKDHGVDKHIASKLFDQMVLFAEYCFNKSHSTAYGAVTYQTAYLKANYPVAYMAALLTVNSGSSDKVQRYIGNCNAMGIEVLRPDVNESGLDFTPVGQQIRFGLGAVRNLGEGAVKAILASRDQDGPFHSLADLCDRLPVGLLNKRALEALIHSGALDGLESQGNRAQLMADMELVVSWASDRAKDRASGQGSIFDLAATTASSSGAPLENAPKAPATKEYDLRQKLRLEKEIVGFYLSDHPLKPLRNPARLLAPVSLADLDQLPDKHKVSAIVMVSVLKIVTTRKGDPMGVLTVEDLSGSCEAVVFPKTYAQLQEYLSEDTRLLLWATVDRRDEQVQLIIDDCSVVEDINLVLVTLEAGQAGDLAYQAKLRTCLQSQSSQERVPAKSPVVIELRHQNARRYVRVGHQFRVCDADATVKALHRAHFEARRESLMQAALA
ncbi:DNA polymerase III subunit alpha [Candidatus Synechococcus spongiarum]|uniref:DNA polymerase III subunit alpha n=1 Tax=Candidatus Synechococcus spongiarum TaxID=431041 RepID=UPI00047034EE|nr:DNA polymerase III subunit alpha [Candidatus Synechococcus spongiarum]